MVENLLSIADDDGDGDCDNDFWMTTSPSSSLLDDINAFCWSGNANPVFILLEHRCGCCRAFGELLLCVIKASVPVPTKVVASTQQIINVTVFIVTSFSYNSELFLLSECLRV